MWHRDALTRDDFSDPHRTLNIRNAMFTLIDEGVIPVINENGTASASTKSRSETTIHWRRLTASLWNADLMIISSDIDGVYDKDPKTESDAKLIDLVENADRLIETISIGGTSSFGTGGIASKIEAASRVNKFGTSDAAAQRRKRQSY